MNDQEWEKWSRNYCLVFGLVTEADLAMVESWRVVFAFNGFGFSELATATNWIAGNCPPAWKTEHLGTIRDFIRKHRSDVYHQETRGDYTYTCAAQLCDGSGLVIVPHWRCVSDGRWVYPWYALSVYCVCKRGERIKASHQARYPKAPSITEYETINPEWFQQKQVRQKERAQEVSAARAAVQAAGHRKDLEDFDRILDRIIQKAIGED